uniref:Uncharacterized protein n=1 Tax=Arundo donax TaxID=35708 RepID=A0A0A8ZDA6_ARUDO
MQKRKNDLGLQLLVAGSASATCIFHMLFDTHASSQ